MISNCIYIRAICGYTFDDSLSSAYLLTKCNIVGVETFLIQSEIHLVGHVVRVMTEYFQSLYRIKLTVDKGVLDDRDSSIMTR